MSTTPAAIEAQSAQRVEDAAQAGNQLDVHAALSHALASRKHRTGQGYDRGVFDHAERRKRLSERLQAAGVELLFLGLSADLEYLSGVERGIPFFGQSSYAHGWVAGGFFRPDADPVYVLPRMVMTFDLPMRPEGELVVVDETDDGFGVFERVAKSLGQPATVAIGDRVLGGDDAQSRPRLRLRPAPDRVVARQRAPPREDGGGARGDGASVQRRSSRRWRRSRPASCQA